MVCIQYKEVSMEATNLQIAFWLAVWLMAALLLMDHASGWTIGVGKFFYGWAL
jgi:hypothetical protein